MQVNLKRTELLDKLESNRAAHRDIFLKAQDGYIKAVIRQLERMLSDARDGKRFDHSVRLPAPIDQTKEYDRAIAMFKMSVDDTIQLQEHEFAQYVMDDWNWKDQFITTNSRYM